MTIINTLHGASVSVPDEGWYYLKELDNPFGYMQLCHLPVTDIRSLLENEEYRGSQQVFS